MLFFIIFVATLVNTRLKTAHLKIMLENNALKTTLKEIIMSMLPPSPQSCPIIIPAIDLKDGKCVRLKQGRMNDDTIFSNDPVAMASRWVREGARRLHLVDLNGAFDGVPVHKEVVADIAKAHPKLPIQLGGGVRTLSTIEHYLNAGLTDIIIGTKAVEEPAFVKEACREFAGHIMVGIDAKDGMVATHGWATVTNIKAVELAKHFADMGVSSIVYTDIARDGMMQGVNVEQTIHLAKQSGLPVIASGGVTDISDIHTLKPHAQYLKGIITGRAIYEGTLDLGEAQMLLDAD